MTKRLKKEKCSVCNKLFFHLNRMFKDRKGKFVCMGCDEGASNNDKCGDIN
jgi:hypothetical protein